MMHKLSYGMSKLLNKLQTYEFVYRTAKVGGEANVEGFSSKFKKIKRGFGGKGGGQAQKLKQNPKDNKPNNKKRC